MLKRPGALEFGGGLALALAGVWAMWSGWDVVQLERGWALVIAGATAFSAGAIVMALARVIAAIRAATEARPETAAAAPAAAAPAVTAPAVAAPAPAPVRQTPAKSFADRPRYDRQDAPTEVDRYTAGDAEYVMLSDGSVEVRSGGYTQRYESLAALRMAAASRRE